MISKEHELTLRTYELEGQVEEWKLKHRALESKLNELQGTENIELRR